MFSLLVVSLLRPGPRVHLPACLEHLKHYNVKAVWTPKTNLHMLVHSPACRRWLNWSLVRMQYDVVLRPAQSALIRVVWRLLHQGGSGRMLVLPLLRPLVQQHLLLLFSVHQDHLQHNIVVMSGEEVHHTGHIPA